jgi:hypothetical protein
VTRVGIPIIELHDEHIDALFGQRVANKADDERDVARLRRSEVESTNGKQRRSSRQSQRGSANPEHRNGDGHKSGFHGGHL